MSTKINTKQRWKMILEVIRTKDVKTVGQLSAILKENGIRADQKTLSEDIKSLHIVKAFKVSHGASEVGLSSADAGLGIDVPDYYSTSKQARHRMIVDLFNQYGPMTQMELVDALAERGVEVRQATVSRDLGEMRNYISGNLVPFSPAKPRIERSVREAVVKRHEEGVSTSAIAQEFSISMGSVARIVAENVVNDKNIH